jgi:hypothetical protein
VFSAVYQTVTNRDPAGGKVGLSTGPSEFLATNVSTLYRTPPIVNGAAPSTVATVFAPPTGDFLVAPPAFAP